MTLDHVTPRRGQLAYDRRDNLVLACRACNAAKTDKPLLAFLLADRLRAARLLRFGDHLSTMLIDMAEALAGPLAGYSAAVRSPEESPYSET
jgi:HNH endonuclease